MKGEGKCAPVQKKKMKNSAIFITNGGVAAVSESTKHFWGTQEVNRLTATQHKLTVRTLSINAATSSRNSSEDSAKIIPFVTLRSQLMLMF